MKINIILIFFTFAFYNVKAVGQDTWRPEGSHVTYGVQGKGLWHVGTQDTDPRPNEARDAAIYQDLYVSGVHPFQWQNEFRNRAGRMLENELLWHISGSASDLNSELARFDKDGTTSFVWESAPDAPIMIHVILEHNGFGRLKVFQGNQIIASVRCVSGKTAKIKPKTGAYKIFNKDANYFSREFKRPMKWALGVDPKRGIYIHGRNIGQNSHGCIGVTPAAMPWVFRRAQLGQTVSISNADNPSD